MRNSLDDLSLSRTFQVADGVLSAVDLFGSGPQSAGVSINASKRHRVGDLIDNKYQVLAPIGEGGMGIVFRVMHISLNKEVALKTFLRGEMAPEAWERFQREAKALAKLTHPNIIQVFDSGVSELNFPFYTMELLVGESLAERIEKNGRLTIAEALPVFAAVAAGLAHAHRLGIVHRDIKPANIFIHRVGEHETPKIVDFGLAKLAQSQSEASLALTSPGLVFGSPLFMSPEQSKGLETDKRTDIYSFGCSLFQALTGEPPLRGSNYLATIMLHQEEKPPPMVEVAPDVRFPQRLEASVAKMLAKDLNSRYQSFEEVLADLLQVEIAHSLLSQQGSQSPSPTSQVAASSVRRPVKIFMPEVKKNTDNSADFGQIAGLGKFVTVAIIAISGVLLLGLMCFFWFGLQSNKTIASSPVVQALPAKITATSPLAEKQGSTVDPAPKVWSGALASADSASEKPYTFFSKRNAKGDIIFDFPPGGELIGQLSWTDHPQVDARGRVVVPEVASKSVRFDAGEGMLNDPALWSRFRSDDLFDLRLSDKGEISWSHDHIVQISKLKHLRCLELKSETLKNDDFQSLNNLTDLVRLSINCAVFDADALCSLKRLRSLDQLQLNETDGAAKVLEQLRGSTAITYLALNKCALKDSDLEIIGTMPNLSCLLIADNESVSLKGLSYLTKCRRLQRLQARNDLWGPDAIEYLVKFPALIYLEIGPAKESVDRLGWDARASQRLHKVLPHCQINEPY